MKILNISILVFFLIFFTSCSNSNEDTSINTTNDTIVEEVEETVKEPANNIWLSAKKGDIESIKQAQNIVKMDNMIKNVREGT